MFKILAFALVLTACFGTVSPASATQMSKSEVEKLLVGNHITTTLTRRGGQYRIFFVFKDAEHWVYMNDRGEEINYTWKATDGGFCYTSRPGKSCWRNFEITGDGDTKMLRMSGEDGRQRSYQLKAGRP